MKKCRENVFGNPTRRSPFVPRICYEECSYQLFKALKETRRREGLTAYDTLAYTNAVKNLFRDEQERYAEFCGIMLGCKTKRFDVDGLKSRIKELFKGNENFILGFNIFLPEDCSEINPSPESESESSKIEPHYSKDTRDFLDSIWGKLQDNCYKRNSFLDILNLHRKCGYSVEGVYQEIEYLFEDDEQLLEPFKKFYSKNSTTNFPIQYASPRQNSSLPQENQRSSVPNSQQMLCPDAHVP